MALTLKGRRYVALGLASLAVVTAIGAAGFVAYPFYTDWRAGNTQEDLRGGVRQLEHQGRLRKGSDRRLPAAYQDHHSGDGDRYHRG